jgi:predicted DsbA family dithiol-disulfide isomerase
MQIDIWSDVMCPWCAVGKARFEAALSRFEHRDAVTVRWRSFELDPNAPAETEGEYVMLLARKYGRTREQAQSMIDQMTKTAADAGLDFDFSKVRPGNTFDAHRLLHLAAERGCQDALKTRLLRAYLSEGEAVGQPEVLQRLATEVGLDAQEVAALLSGDGHADAVRHDEQQAREFGINGVPFFVLGGRFAVSGAQPAEVMEKALEKAWDKAALEVSAGATCDDEGCAI